MEGGGELGKEGGRRWSGCYVFWALEWCFWGVLLPRVCMDEFSVMNDEYGRWFPWPRGVNMYI